MNSTDLQIITRFAPSPTGYLHLGHAYSALYAYRAALDAGGRFLVRLEDIDPGRSRPAFESAIYEDLAWLGLEWEMPVRRQSDHMEEYAAALEHLDGRELIYPCFCTRKEIAAEIKAAGGAPHDMVKPELGATGPLYPGTCRGLSQDERIARIDAGDSYALRLDMDAACRAAGPLTWRDAEAGEVRAAPEIFGDVVLARKEFATSYHLAVTLDDHVQGITLVTRGEDLRASTHVHRLLQELFGLAAPVYDHHGLLTRGDGKKFSKRDKAKTLRALRDEGYSADEVKEMAWQEVDR